MDLVWGLIFVALLSAVSGIGGVLASQRLSRGASGALAIGMVALLVWYAYIGREEMFWAQIWPYSNLIVVANLLPYGLAFLAGICWVTTPGSWWRRAIPVVAVAALGVFGVIGPLLGSPPPCTDLWDGDTCLQSSPATCSAASIATLLKVYDITATEAEIARLCLTRKGTSWQGIYRGLKLKTAGTPWRVVVSQPRWQELSADADHPLLIDVGLTRFSEADRIYSEEYGWEPGRLHSVLFCGFLPERRVAIAEPTAGVGRETWSIDDLAVLYRGRAYGLQR